VEFARCFGELELHPFIPSNTEHPELVRFEKTADVAGYENLWHHDVTWRENPSMGAILHALDVPELGGDTLFADMHAAYEGLEPQLRERIDGLFAVHDYMRAFGHTVAPDQVAQMREQYPEVVHPVVRTHPETGQRSLFVNRVFTREILGVEPEESESLITYLGSEATHPEYQIRVRWEPDTLVFWDNRAVMHYASSDYWPQRRVMERASIIGDRPR
jgi:alpha-ketoglutarate-dependent taurine dioxygenase